MRFVRGLRTSLVFFAGLPSAASSAQVNHTTAVTLASVLANGTPVAFGKLCATATDGFSNSITFSSAGWGVVAKNNSFCGNVINGSVPGGVPVPDAAKTNRATPVSYTFSLQLTDSSFKAESAAVTLFPNVSGVTGATFPLDNYTPAASTEVTSSVIGGGTSVPTSCTGPSLWTVPGTPPLIYVCNAGVYTLGVTAAATVVYGSSSGTAAEGNDPRIIAAAKIKGTWASGLCYDQNDVSSFALPNAATIEYYSLVPGTCTNTNNSPATSPLQWRALSGVDGAAGAPGAAATVAIGTVTTVAPGTPAAVDNSTGTPQNAVLDFTIPKGDVGATGAVGPQGSIGLTGPAGPTGATGQAGIQGPVGPAGSVGLTGPAGPTGAAGQAGVQGPVGPAGSIGLTGAAGPSGPAGPTGLTGSPGAQGAVGPAGTPGAAASLAVGTVTTGAPGSQAVVTNSGSSSNAVFDITVPQGPVGPAGAAGPQGVAGTAGTAGAAGAQGNAATLAVGTVTTGAPGSSAVVTNSGSSSNAVFDITVPQGPVGPIGPTGQPGPTGATGPQGIQGLPGNGGTTTFAAMTGVASPSQLPAATNSAPGIVQLDPSQTSSVLSKVASSGSYSDLQNIPTTIPFTNVGNAWGAKQTMELVQVGPVYDIRSFGAKSDGVTDDAAAIQFLISNIEPSSFMSTCGSVYFVTSKACGVTVLFPRGVTVVSQLSLPPYVRLKGVGEEQSVMLQLSGYNGNMIVLQSPTASLRDVIEDMTLNGNAANQTTVNDGIHFDNTGAPGDRNHQFHNLRIENFTGNGMDVFGAFGDDTVSNIHVYRNGLAGIVWTAPDSKLERVDSALNAGDGIDIGGGNVTMSDSKFWYNGVNPLAQYAACTSAARGIVQTGSRMRIENSEAQDNCGDGMHASGDSQLDTGMLMDGNGKINFANGTQLYAGFVPSGLSNSYVQVVTMSQNEQGAGAGASINSSLQAYGVDFSGEPTASSNNTYVITASQNTVASTLGYPSSSDFAEVNGTLLTKQVVGPIQPSTSTTTTRPSNLFELCADYWNGTVSTLDCTNEQTVINISGTAETSIDHQHLASATAPLIFDTWEPLGTATAAANFNSMMIRLASSLYYTDGKSHSCIWGVDDEIGAGTTPPHTLTFTSFGYCTPQMNFGATTAATAGSFNGMTSAGWSAAQAQIAANSTAVNNLQSVLGSGGAPSAVNLSDEFIGGTNVSGNIGQLGWNTSSVGGSGSNLYVLNGGVSHPGVLQIGTAAAAGAGAVLYLVGSTSPNLAPSTLAGWSSEYIGETVSVSQLAWREGFVTALPATTVPSAGVYFRYDNTLSTPDAYYMACVAIGSSEACTPTTVAPAASAYHDFTIASSTLGIYSFTVGTAGTAVSTVTICTAATSTSCTLNTTVPTTSTPLFPAIWQFNGTTAATNYMVTDYWLYQQTGLVR